MSLPESYKELARELRPHRVSLYREIHDVLKKFGAFDKSVMEPGQLDTKTKELIAVGISVAIRCDECIGFHVDAAVAAGADRKELAEAASVAVLLGGGPGLMYATHAMKAIDEYCGKNEPDPE